MSCTKNGSYCEMKKREKKSGGGGVRGMCTKNERYCEKGKKVGVTLDVSGKAFVKIHFYGGRGVGVRVDVNGEVNLL